MARTIKSSKTNKEVGQPEKTVLWQVAFWGLAVLLFLPPFFRGLFFAPEQRIALLFALIILGMVCLWKWYRKDYTVLSHPMDYFMLALPVVYIISSFNSVNSGLAVDEVVKAVLYFVVYWIVVQLVRKRKDAETIMIVIYLSAFLVALAALMTASGLIIIRDGFVSGRLASTLQYSNALASYMAAVFAIGAYLWWKHSHGNSEESILKTKFYPYISCLLAAGNCLLVAVLIGTKSNGGFIVFGLGAVMLFALLPGINRFLVLLHMVIITVPAAGSIYFFIININEKHNAQAWLWILAGLLMAGVLQWIYINIVDGGLKREKIQRRLLVGAVVLVLIIGLVVSLTFTDTIKSLTGEFKADSLADRVYFIEDSFSMIKEHPLFGWGGGGWQEAYQYFQSYSYTSRQVHSHYIQVAVETGAAGVAATTGLWLTFLYSLYRSYRRKDNIFASFLGVSVLIFGIHAAADFDLSLSALSLVLYTTMAVIRNLDRGVFEEVPPSSVRKNKGKLVLVLTASVGILALLLLIPLLSAQSYYRDSMDLYKKGDKSAVTYMEKAVFYDPFHVEYRVALSDLHRAVGQLDKSLTDLNQALLRSKYSPDIRARLSQLALQRGDVEKAVEYAEETIKLAPWQIAYYELAGLIYREAALGELKDNRPQQAREYFVKAAKIPEMVNNRNKELEHSYKQNLSPDFYVTPKIFLTAGIGSLFTGDLNEAEKNLKGALKDEKSQREAFIWLSLLMEMKADNNKALEYMDMVKPLLPDYENYYREYKELLYKGEMLRETGH